MVAVDKDTGALVWQKVLDDDPSSLVAASPAVDQGVLYVGVSSQEEGAALTDPNHVYRFRGSVVALDPTTGTIAWKTPMIDDAVYFNTDGTRSGYAGAAVWSGTPTIDRRRKQLYVTTGNNYAVSASLPDGGALPPGDRLESIVALDMTTGTVRWSQRMTAGDVWTFEMFGNADYDFGCGANLFQATISDAVHDIVGAGQKSGVYWAVDADTGSVLWHTVVGPGGHLGGIHWGTATDGQRIYVGVNDETGVTYDVIGTPAGADAGHAPAPGRPDAVDPGRVVGRARPGDGRDPLAGREPDDDDVRERRERERTGHGRERRGRRGLDGHDGDDAGLRGEHGQAALVLPERRDGLRRARGRRRGPLLG